MSSPNIQFSTMPSNIRVPGQYFEENVSNAITGLTPSADRMVIIGQRLSTGSVSAKVPTTVFDGGQASLYFGAGSQCALAVNSALTANPNLDLSVVAIDDPAGGTAARYTLTATPTTDSTASVAGIIDLWIGDVHVSTGVSVSDADTAIIGNIYTALQAVSSQIPFTFNTPSGAILTLTCRHTGVIGNFSAITSATSSDVSLVINEAVTGAGVPDVGAYGTASTVLNSIAGAGYTVIASCLPDSGNMTKVSNLINFVSGPIEERPATAYVGYTDEIGTGSDAIVLASSLNSGRIGLPFLNYSTGNQAKTEPWKIGCAFASMMCFNSDPAIPYDQLPLTGVSAPAIADRFTWAQKQNFLNSGVTPLYVAPGEQVSIVRAISTYTLNSLGLQDPTLLDINTLRTLDYVRAQVRTRLSLRFPRAKLSTKTPARVRSQVLDVLFLLEQLEIVQNVKVYEAGVIVERDSSTVGQLNIKIPTNVISGLHVIAGVLDLIL